MKGTAVLVIARLAKGVALLGFALPWLTVSCAGQPIMTVSGLELATGSFDVRNPLNDAAQHYSGPPVLLFAIAAAAIVAGLLLSLWLKRNAAAGALMATSILAGGMIVVGQNAAEEGIRKAPTTNADLAQQIDASLAQSFQIMNRYGFWVVLGSLGACLACGVAAFAGEEEPKAVRSPAPPGPWNPDAISPSTPSYSPDEDFAFWDGAADKNDRDFLEEYLIRFPHGRFEALAKRKLGRDAHAAAPTRRTCTECNVALDEEASFCSQCGARVSIISA